MIKTLLRVSVFFTILIFGCIVSGNRDVQAAEMTDIWTNNNILWSNNTSPNPIGGPEKDVDFKPMNGLFDLSGTSSRLLQNGIYNVGTQLTGSSEQNPGTGMLKSKSTNLLDLNHDFVIRTRVKMSRGVTDEQNADGIGFFMTGDSTTTLGDRTGEQLGVWGQWDKHSSNGADPSKTAMQDSFAIVINAYLKAANRRSIHQQIGSSTSGHFQQYIAHGYPAQQNSYTHRGSYWNLVPATTYHYYNLNFNDQSTGLDSQIVTGLLSDTWVPLVIEYESKPSIGGGTLKYTYGNVPFREITWTGADLDKYFGENKRQLYWGFTGTTAPDRKINSSVLIESLTGTVNVSAEPTLTDLNGDPIPADTIYEGDQLLQNFVVTYDSSSRQKWPLSENFEVQLTTGKNYTFQKNSEGTVDVVWGTQTIKARVIDEENKSINFTASGILGTAGVEAISTFSAKIVATGTADISDKVPSAISGDNGEITGSAILPVPQKRLYQLVSVPNLSFKPVTMAQVFSGTKTQLISPTSAVVSAVNNYSNQSMRLKASMNTFALSQSYASGGIIIKFNAGNDTDILLKDNGSEVIISENMGSQDAQIDLNLTNMEMRIAPTFDLLSKGYKADIFWTIENTM